MQSLCKLNCESLIWMTTTTAQLKNEEEIARKARVEREKIK
jgi:hypothetical protein